MRTITLAVVLIICASALDTVIPSAASQPGRPSERQRKIKFHPETPIPDRLLPDDSVVVVEKEAFPPLRALDVDPTLDAAIERAMLYEAIVVVRNLNPKANLVDRGTWIRGTVTGSIVEVIKPSPYLGPSKLVSFWHDNGEMFIKNVLVRAGAFPVYSANETYVLFLGYDEARGLYPGRSFRITAEGTLASILRSNGETIFSSSPMKDQPAELVLRKLRERVSRK